MNTGLLQATVAYKNNDLGEPVDVDGQLTSVSGKRQAIALMVGKPNPNPVLYEVEFYFSPRSNVNGQPTTTVDFQYCPVSIFTIDTTNLVLHPGNIDDVVNIFSTYGWQWVGPFDYATATPPTGGALNTAVTIARTATLGQGYMNFKDNTTSEVKSIYVINTDALGWILATGFWNNLRFWDPAGTWNY